MADIRNRSQVTRRKFLQLSAIAVAGAGALLAGCQPSSPPQESPKSGAPAAGAASSPGSAAAPTAPPAPRKGGTLTWAQWDSNEDLDPALSSGASATEIINQILDTVVAMDANQKIYPALAAKWLIEDDAKKISFTLRDDVKFHDGTPLDSTAVKRSWDRILDPQTKAGGVVPLFGPVDKILAPDPRTVVVTFKQPYPAFLLQIWRAYFGILSPKLLDTIKPGQKVSRPVGTGPFEFVDRSPDGVVTVKAFADYAWGPEVVTNRKAPHLQTIKFRTITEAATRTATLESGENLLIDELPEPDYIRLKGDKRFRFLLVPRGSHSLGFYFNVQKPPTNDKAVREAVNWAIDRQSMVDRLFFGVHKVAVGPMSDGVWGRLEELEKSFGYDPKKSVQILEAAGWKPGSDGIRQKDGQKLSILLATFRSPWTEMAEVMQAQLREVGIDLQIQKMARGPYLDFVRSYQHNMNASAGTSLDPDGVLRLAYHSQSASNFSNLKLPEIDAMLDRGSQQAIGSPERRKTYEDLQRKIMEIMPFVAVMSQVRIQAMTAKLNDFRMGPDGLNAYKVTDAWLEG